MRRSILLALACLPAFWVAGCGKKGQAAPDASSNEVRQFHDAINDGDAEIVRRLLAAKPYLANAKNEQGVTPLNEAEQHNNDEVADVIRKAGGRE